LKDIGEKGIDEEVHGFASNDIMVEGHPLPRRQTPYDYNGQDPSAHPSDFLGVRFLRPRKDIGEGGVDPEVHGFVRANNMVPPIHNARTREADLANGSDASSHEAPELPGKFKYAQNFLGK
jgi:hypothetical protein